MTPSSPARLRSDRRGFTLLEMLIALIITSIILVILVSTT
jgi:prepilin-type N-terminal cleavage/methylation domain-containing protein